MKLAISAFLLCVSIAPASLAGGLRVVPELAAREHAREEAAGAIRSLLADPARWDHMKSEARERLAEATREWGYTVAFDKSWSASDERFQRAIRDLRIRVEVDAARRRQAEAMNRPDPAPTGGTVTRALDVATGRERAAAQHRAQDQSLKPRGLASTSERRDARFLEPRTRVQRVLGALHRDGALRRIPPEDLAEVRELLRSSGLDAASPLADWKRAERLDELGPEYVDFDRFGNEGLLFLKQLARTYVLSYRSETSKGAPERVH